MTAVQRAVTAARAIKRGQVYYGWYIVALAFLSQFIGGGVDLYSFTIFLKPMTADLGWSRGDFSAAQSLSSIVMAATGFVIGGMVDRHGGRWLMVFGAIVFGASAMALSQVHELWQFFLIRSLFFVIGSACVGRLVVNVTLSKWFVRHRGTAIAFAWMGINLSGLTLVPLTSALIEVLGWRSAWIVLGGMVWVVIIAPAALIMRRQPEDMGLLPDGDSPDSLTQLAEGRRRRRSAASEEQWTRGEAVRTWTMWLLVVAFAVALLGVAGLLLHLVAFLTDHGFSQGTAAFLVTVSAMAGLVSQPILGYFADIVPPRFLAAMAFSITGTAILMILHLADAGSVWALVPFIGLWGVGVSANPILQETVWATHFGRRHIGSIRSVALPFSLGFGAAGPLIAGYLFEVTGGYTLPFTIYALAAYVGSILVLLAFPPRKQAPPATGSVSSQ